MPPRDCNLIDELRLIGDIHVMFNLEVWDPDRFRVVCPGKEADYGRGGMLAALQRLRDVVGPYRAHSLLVTGLEDPTSTLDGMTWLAANGISPIANIYHSDPYSALGLGSRPSFNELVRIAQGLSDLYAVYPILPYWRRCGRNSIDAEAAAGMFREPLPEFLSVQSRHA
jgi:hypothetical protein